MPFNSTRKLRERLEEQHRQQQLKDEENARRQKELEDMLVAQRRRHEQEEYQRNERERQKVEKEQIEREREIMIIEQKKMEDAERENQRLNELRQAEPETVRRLRNLIRTRYQMDMYIWSLRGVQKANQDIVIKEGRKADAILDEIYAIVDTWEEGSGWTPEEWRTAKRIKDQLTMSAPRVWENNPPWNEV